jgi:FtsP/CotA-like multicopper oxidase with cupredoxin domain
MHFEHLSNVERTWQVSRRGFMLGATATAAAAVTGCSRVAARVGDIQLAAKAGRARLLSDSTVSTAVFGYGGQVPGRELRLRQGDRLRVSVKNELQEETTVHWHGIRLPNAMDGVPHLTQKPIKPGETFLYDFVAPDAGTYWYHPHHNSSQQVGRGLYGPLIVEEAEPIKVDRDITWLLGDWRLLEDGQISDDFGNMHDSMHAGRVGNTITINGRAPQPLAVRTGERVRLRLINAANARIFGLKFAGHSPKIVALDGQPVTPHEPSGSVLVGPAMRVDLIIDMVGDPSLKFAVEDTFYKGLEYTLTTLEYGPNPLRQALLTTPIALPPNRIAEPHLRAATRHEITFSGGMGGGMGMMGGGMMGGGMGMMGGMSWAINGVSATSHTHEPMLTFARGKTVVLNLNNDTAWWHPIHLHGHSFRVISRNGKPTAHREWQDTVLMPPRETAEIAFVADNPGDWMFHCHVLEHQAAGMMANLRVA